MGHGVEEMMACRRDLELLNLSSEVSVLVSGVEVLLLQRDAGVVLVPWLNLVEIDVLDDIEINPSGSHLLPKVVIHQLFVRRVETKSRRNLRLLRAAAAHTRSIHFDRSPG
uniref:Uncharacterized protein n=1 Tax=Oryza meridionalis TaxID=40149 RepID=A0A0E0DVH2_9ORYZ